MQVPSFLLASFLAVGTVSSQESSATSSSDAHERRIRALSVTEREDFVKVEDSSVDSVEIQGDTDKNGRHHITFTLESGTTIQIVVCPKTQEIEIHQLGGNSKYSLTADDTALLAAVVDKLDDGPAPSRDAVDKVKVQIRRAAKLLGEWPSDMDIDFVFDAEAEMEREEKRYQEMLQHLPDPKNTPPNGDRRHLLASRLAPPVTVDDQGRRRLEYTSLCNYVGCYVEATHDNWWYDNYDDESTFYALVGNFPTSCPGDATAYWKNNAWTCTEPDHDPDVEYAKGECFGRCGPGCGGDTQYTLDCLNHDSCVRFGHSIASMWCNDEFSYCVDDELFAPDCPSDNQACSPP